MLLGWRFWGLGVDGLWFVVCRVLNRIDFYFNNLSCILVYAVGLGYQNKFQILLVSFYLMNHVAFHYYINRSIQIAFYQPF